MIKNPWQRVFLPICLCLLLLVSACASAPSRYEKVQNETTRRGAPGAVVKTAEQGSTFNKFFPKAARGFEVIPAQEKKGFAEYKLNKDGKTVAVMSINDTSSIPTAAAKYENSELKVAGYPAVQQGNTGTAILVNGRYQVKIQSRDPEFTEDDRTFWLNKFDLRGLSQLKTAQNLNTPAKAPSLVPQPAT